ncbi:hypothetical protein Pssp01_57690 [Pseudomonas sp. NBRC 100443]|nr:hypothetical protein Pssp01_57690 [Pseudomonas sp. NBRC 100443]
MENSVHTAKQRVNANVDKPRARYWSRAGTVVTMRTQSLASASNGACSTGPGASPDTGGYRSTANNVALRPITVDVAAFVIVAPLWCKN